jgi:hypothetical protein
MAVSVKLRFITYKWSIGRKIEALGASRSIGNTGVRWVNAKCCCESEEMILFLHKDSAQALSNGEFA